MRKVFLESLPTKEGIGINKGQQVIDWIGSVGCRVKIIYDNIVGEVEIIDYDGRYLYVSYSDKSPYKISAIGFASCSLKGLLKGEINNFKYNIGDKIIDNRRNLIITDRKTSVSYDRNNKKYTYKYYKYKCNKCGFKCGEHYKNQEYQNELWILESNLLTGKNGCACCSIPSKIVVEGINDIPTTVPWMVKYFQGGYEESKLYNISSNKKIYPICPDCGQVKSKSISINHINRWKNIFCPCGDGKSYPEKLMYNILKQLNMEFEMEFSPKWIKPRRYDFYIPHMNLIIEMDGALGHGYGVYSKSDMTIEKSIKIDKYKDKMANIHNIDVVRINCEESNLEFIKTNILNSKLKIIFDLTKIDWNECEGFALSNLVKKVCEYKKDNPNATTGDVGKVFDLQAQTVRDYLIKGSKIWNWIEYDSEKEMINIGIKCGKSRRKMVEIFKNETSLGVFSSCSELERLSEKLFNVKLNNSKISMVCNGKQKTHKGYTFKYV